MWIDEFLKFGTAFNFLRLSLAIEAIHKGGEEFHFFENPVSTFRLTDFYTVLNFLIFYNKCYHFELFEYFCSFQFFVYMESNISKKRNYCKNMYQKTYIYNTNGIFNFRYVVLRLKKHNSNSMGKRKRKDRSPDPERPVVPLEEREKNQTIIVSLTSYVHHKAVEAMFVVGNEAWNRVVCFGNDAVHSFVRQELQDKLPLPDLEDAKFWNCAFGYTIKRSTHARDQKDTDIVERFRTHYDTFFNDHDTLRPGFHDNFTESMGTLEATANKNYNSWETLNNHLTMYLRGKYQLKCKNGHER